MKYRRNIFLSAFWVLLGAALLVSGMAGAVDSYWSAMGAAFIGVGSLRVFRFIRCRRDGDYREKVDTANSDERNRFISGRAWVWAGYLFVLIAAIASVALHVLGQRELGLFASCSVCLFVLLYWLSWLVLQRRY